MARPRLKPRYRYVTPKIYDCECDTFVKRRFTETKKVIKNNLKSLGLNLETIKKHMQDGEITQENLDEMHFFLHSMLKNSNTLIKYLNNNVGSNNGITYA